MKLRKQLREWREPHTMDHIVMGRTLDIEKEHGVHYHIGKISPEEYCAICLTCNGCVACSILGLTHIVKQDALAHADDMALHELRKLGVRILDEMDD